jgi:hypothetical protein
MKNNLPTIDFNKIYKDEKFSDDESVFDVFNPKLSEKQSSENSKHNYPVEFNQQLIKPLNFN